MSSKWRDLRQRMNRNKCIYSSNLEYSIHKPQSSILNSKSYISYPPTSTLFHPLLHDIWLKIVSASAAVQARDMIHNETQ